MSEGKGLGAAGVPAADQGAASGVEAALPAAVERFLERIPPGARGLKRLLRRGVRLGLSHRALLEKAALALGLRGLAAVSSLLLNIMLGRALGPAGLGLYFLATTIARMLGLVGTWGGEQSSTRLVARARARGRHDEARGAAQTAMIICGAGSTVMAVLLYLLAGPIAVGIFNNPDLVPVLKAVAPLIVLHGFTLVIGGLFVAVERAGLAVFINALGAPLAGVIIYGFLVGERTLGTAIQSVLISTALTGLAGLALWAVIARKALGSGQAPIDFGPAFKSGVHLVLVTLVARAQEWMTVILLGILATATELAQFSLPNRITGLMMIILIAVNMTVRGRYASLHATGDTAGLERLARVVNGLTMVLAAGPTLVLLAFPGFIMGLFGDGFVSAAPILQLLAVTQWFAVSMGSVGQLLLMGGLERVAMRISVGCALLLLVALLIAIPVWGAIGAAVAAALTTVIQRIWTTMAVRRHMGIRLGVTAFF
ncbi:MAG: oligosaccharide flippase family protein [Alphaproteobacteria bacterium]|nr:oligosaccharide flippase family protein [Alphaproteobacteria bacterium]